MGKEGKGASGTDLVVGLPILLLVLLVLLLSPTFWPVQKIRRSRSLSIRLYAAIT